MGGPGGIELYLLDPEQLEEAKKSIEEMIASERASSARKSAERDMESNITENAPASSEFLLKDGELLLEFKDGGVLCFQAASNLECLEWLNGIAKLWLYCALENVPAWYFACTTV